MIKTCAKCKIKKTLNNFWKNKGRNDGYNSYCKLCQDSYRVNNLKVINELGRIRRNKLREEILKQYGGKCTCCGELEYKFLAFDHINGGGNKHKILVGRGEKFLRWIVKNNYPSILQILCHNCNQAKGAWGKCPHEA